MYNLNRRYVRLVGKASILEDAEHSDELSDYKEAGVIFSIIGDGKVYWESKTISKTRETESFDVDVESYTMIQLRARSVGGTGCL